MLGNLRQSSPTSPETEERRVGIEKYLILNPACIQQGSSITSRLKTYNRDSGNFEDSKYKNAESAVHQYIKTLIKQLEKHYPGNFLAFFNLETILKRMTKSDPAKRCSITEAINDFSRDFHSLLGDLRIR